MVDQQFRFDKSVAAKCFLDTRLPAKLRSPRQRILHPFVPEVT